VIKVKQVRLKSYFNAEPIVLYLICVPAVTWMAEWQFMCACMYERGLNLQLELYDLCVRRLELNRSPSTPRGTKFISMKINFNVFFSASLCIPFSTALQKSFTFEYLMEVGEKKSYLKRHVRCWIIYNSFYSLCLIQSLISLSDFARGWN
jgi:hypothetical protein